MYRILQDHIWLKAFVRNTRNSIHPLRRTAPLDYAAYKRSNIHFQKPQFRERYGAIVLSVQPLTK